MHVSGIGYYHTLAYACAYLQGKVYEFYKLEIVHKSKNLIVDILIASADDVVEDDAWCNSRRGCCDLCPRRF